MALSFGDIAKTVAGSGGNPLGIITSLLAQGKEKRAADEQRHLERSEIQLRRDASEQDLNELYKQIAMARIPFREGMAQSGMADSTSGQIANLDFEQQNQGALDALRRQREGLELGIKQSELQQEMDTYLRRMGYLDKGIKTAGVLATMGMGGTAGSGTLGNALAGGAMPASSGPFGASNPFAAGAGTAGGSSLGQISNIFGGGGSQPQFTQAQQRRRNDLGGGIWTRTA